jgi:hypothetical protein
VFGFGFVVAASGPTIDSSRLLHVNVVDSGWAVVDRGADHISVVPTFAFTLTNTGDRSTNALEVNALFSPNGPRPELFGTSFSRVVGWQGLRPGATSAPLRLRVQGWASRRSYREASHGRLELSDLDEATVKLFVHHEGRWSLLGEYPIRSKLIEP